MFAASSIDRTFLRDSVTVFLRIKRQKSHINDVSVKGPFVFDLSL